MLKFNQNRRNEPGMKTRNVTTYPQRRSAKEVWQLILILPLCSTSQHYNSPPDTPHFTTTVLLWRRPPENVPSVHWDVAHTVSHVTRGCAEGRGGVRTGLSVHPLAEIRTPRCSQRVWLLGVSVGRVHACALLPRPPTLTTLSRPGRCSTYCLFYTTFLRAVSPVGAVFVSTNCLGNSLM